MCFYQLIRGMNLCGEDGLGIAGLMIYLCCQVEEAVAVLQAHQAKKDATQKVGVTAATVAATS